MILQRYLSIRRILVLVSLLFLLLPVGGIYFLRIYESALLRQTESELIAQGAFVAALYQQEIRKNLAEKNVDLQQYGLPVRDHDASGATLHPIPPRLDLASDRIYPARPLPVYTHDTPDAVASAAGNQALPVLRGGQRITLAGIKLLDYQGIVVAGQEEKGLSFAHTEEFMRARSGWPVSLLRQRRMPETQAAPGSISRNSNINVFVALPIVAEHRLLGVVWLNRTPMDLMQALYGKRTELAWTTFGLLLAAILITLLTSLTITRPIRALVRKTRLIAQGDPLGLEPLKHPITREISELSENIAGMAATIQHRSEYIRNFTAHVSHAFKTPLTAMRGSIELLEDNLDEMPREQQQRFLRNLATDTERMGRLVNRLLELARADMSEVSHPQTDLVPLLRQVADRNAAGNLRVVLQCPPDPVAIRVAIMPDSLEAVLMNLLENSRQAGADQIVISVDVQPARCVLTLQDNGPGISEANRTEIFTPFFTTRRDSGGTGLGLSIVQSLLARYRGQIALVPCEAGARFLIILPVV